jgi:ABC-type multidrug transport system fused ATPase/permease subunit
MQILGAIVAGCVGFAVVLEARTIGSTAAGIVLIYSLSFQENLTFLAWKHAECQMDMNSVERIKEYCELDSEKYISLVNSNGEEQIESSLENKKNILTYLSHFLDNARNKALSTNEIGKESKNDKESSRTNNNIYVPSLWPSQGKIEFRNISLKYKSTEEPVLRNISFTIPGKKKIGVVGRTGAGKSSLIAALFRLVEPSNGELFIDDINVLEIPLHSLRNNIAIVPQDPTLFKGSVRFNLDPFNQYSEKEMWDALRCVNLAEHVEQMASANENMDTPYSLEN